MKTEPAIFFQTTVRMHVMPDNDRTIVKQIDLKLNLDNRLDPRAYYDRDGNYTLQAVDAIAQCLIQGLATLVQGAHQHGHKNEAQFMRDIVEELGRSFAHSGKKLVNAIDISNFGTYEESGDEIR